MILLLFNQQTGGIVIVQTAPFPAQAVAVHITPLEWLVSSAGGWSVADSGPWPVSSGSGWTSSSGSGWPVSEGSEWEVR